MYYGDIQIDPKHLCGLLEDDVPIKILGIIHQTDDIGLINQESAGYIPTDRDEIDGQLDLIDCFIL